MKSETTTDAQPPHSLWLQWHGDGDPEQGEVCESEVTWSRDPIFAQDIEYVSKDALQDLLGMLIRCEIWFSTLPEGRKMQLECQRIITLHNAERIYEGGKP
jgi:hypothetical protein